MTAWLERFRAGAPAPRIVDRGRIDALFRTHRMRVMLAITRG